MAGAKNPRVERSRPAGAAGASENDANRPAGAGAVRQVPLVGEGLVSLTLIDFQKHEKFKVVFDPRITVIVGASDRGKSAVLRALGCVAVGEPDGQDLIRHDSEGYKIKLEVPGHTVIRKRGKSGNVYVLDGVRLTRDRGEWPPPQVLNAVRLCPQNFQWQLDGPLWFLDSAGQVAKQLNEVVDLEAIDTVLGEANAAAKKAVATYEGAVQEEESAKHAYQNLKWVPAMLAAWDRCEEKRNKWTKTMGVRDRLFEKHQKAGLLQSKAKKLERPVLAFAAVEASYIDLTATRNKVVALKSVLSKLTKLRRQAEAVDAFRDSWTALCELRAAAERKGERAAYLSETITQLEDLQREADRWQTKVNDLQERLSQVEVCPACGQPVSGS